MKDFSMIWDIQYLVVHSLMLYVVVLLWRKAPDVVQRLFLLIVFASMGAYLAGDVLSIVYGDAGEVLPWRSVAGAIAHGALLIYLARQWWLKTEICQAIKKDAREDYEPE